MKNILKIKIHLLYYFIGSICFLTGYFKYFIITSIFIIIHELGHVSGGIFFHWRLEKVVLLPFGGITIFQEKLNKPIKEEFIILILGPLYQTIFYFLLSYFFLLPEYVTYIHYFLLFLNLIPIEPLDGSKLIHLLFCKFTSYFNSQIYTFYLSSILLSLFLFYGIVYQNFSLLVWLLFLFQKVRKTKAFIPYTMKRFLWERYQYQFSFKKRILVKDTKDMKRDYSHLFKKENGYITEREMLRKIFDLNHIL